MFTFSEQSATVKRLEKIINAEHILKVLKKDFWLRRSCLYSSPKISLLKKGAIVEVIATDRNWAKVSFLDTEEFPVQGWIPRDALAKPTVR